MKFDLLSTIEAGGCSAKFSATALKELLEKIPKPDDAADALAVAICHLHSYRMQKL